MSLQLEKIEFLYGGRSYELVCNMAALDELEAAHGSMKNAMESTPNHLAAELSLIMLNRARKKRGEQPVTQEQLSEEYSYAMLRELDIFGMFLRALSPNIGREEKSAADGETGEPEGN